MKKTLLIICLGLVSTQLFAQNQPYYSHVHSHNDYEQQRPLLFALENGMGSIEADVWYIKDGDGKQQLFVAHEQEEIKEDRTLENLYFAPLSQWIKLHNGQVYNNPNETIFLHVDLKTEDKETWNAVQEVASKYGDLFTQIHPDGSIKKGLVTIFTNIDFRDPNKISYSVKDGRFGNIYQSDNWKNYFTNGNVTPIVSSNLWTYNDPSKAFLIHDEDTIGLIINEYNKINADNPLTRKTQENASFALSKNYPLLIKLSEAKKVEISEYLRSQFNQANQIGESHNTLIRFWNSPDYLDFWEMLADHTFIMINTDHPNLLNAFLSRNKKS